MQKNTIQKAAALKYKESQNEAPIVTAKGNGQIAKNIIQIARQNDIPIKQDEDLINMLSQIELNQEIPEELYKAVAEIFSFIYGVTNDNNK
ncbi:MAG: EscU/YscU/HrcU family type III secretion system export apparatus switch protein [Arcobacteraceae bacterium]|nr:EscU/YscU/HrcU family type III secretion system export apparatus switch protein [Arcobacteraceae bacterium]